MLAMIDEANYFLYEQLPEHKLMKMVDGHGRWALYCEFAMESIHQCETFGWQFEPIDHAAIAGALCWL